MSKKKGKLVSLVSSDDESAKSVSNGTKKSIHIDQSSDDNFDIDRDNSTTPPKRKVLRRTPKKMKNENKNKHRTYYSSEDDSVSEQSMMSIHFSDSDTRNKPSNATRRRRNLERFKNKIKRKNSDSESSQSSEEDCRNTNRKRGTKRRKPDTCSDEETPEPAWKGTNNSYDGDGLTLSYYKNVLGIDSIEPRSEDSDSEPDLDSLNMNGPMRKKRKLNDLNMDNMKSGLAQQQKAEAFGGLPISKDIACNIAKFFTLTEISQAWVLVNKCFSKCFNTDQYWKIFFNSMSKNHCLTEEERKIFKGYKLRTKEDNKICKRRLLWYYTRRIGNPGLEYSFFDVLLQEYIPGLPESDEYKETYFVNRAFVIRLFLAKHCAVMHWNKKNGTECNEYGIDVGYAKTNEEMNIIMPQTMYENYTKQWKAFCHKINNDNIKLTALYDVFNSQWRTDNDIFTGFRYANQLYIHCALNGMVRENVNDLNYLVKIQQFYSRAMNSNDANDVIRALCNENESTIHDIIDIGDEMDTINVTIQSPKTILHKQVKFIMEFINNYDEDGHLCCGLMDLMDEMKERNIIESEEQFENLKALIDRNQFSIKKDCITYET